MKFIYDDGGRSKYFKGKNVGDCMVRAVSIATGKDYKEVYTDLTRLCKKTPRNGVPKHIAREYMRQLGWLWNPTMKIGQGCTVHMREEELPKGTIIVALSHHVACVKDGVVYDTYDSTRNENRCGMGITQLESSTLYIL